MLEGKHSASAEVGGEGCRMSVRMLFEAADTGIGTVDTILTQNLKLHKICDKFVPKKRT